MLLSKKLEGFTLIEIMVAMVVLSIGLLGMAAMTVMVMRGSRGANDLQAGTNICQLKLEELKDVIWANLGNATSGNSTDGRAWGYVNAEIFQEIELNSRGKTAADEVAAGAADPPTSLGPFKYKRSFVVCAGNSPTYPPTGSTANLADDQDCLVDASTNKRTRWLDCELSDITGTPDPDNPEKKIKVLCTWTAKDGKCHSVHLDTTAVSLGN